MSKQHNSNSWTGIGTTSQQQLEAIYNLKSYGKSVLFWAIWGAGVVGVICIVLVALP